MVEVKNLYKKYGDFVALDDLNFDVADGEVFGFVGPNGAGKTTTMRIMAGLNQPDRGSITIAGTDAVKNSKKIKNACNYHSAVLNYLSENGIFFGAGCKSPLAVKSATRIFAADSVSAKIVMNNSSQLRNQQ